MAEDKVTRKLTTILAADVAGYTRLMRADEEATLKTLGDYRDVIDRLIARHEGRVFSTGGDSILAEFRSAVEAVRCAISCQEEITSRNAELADDRKLVFRIGINVGDVMIRDGDLFGDGVNVAARLEGLADPGGVCISGSVFEQIKHKLSLGFEDMGQQEVKNIAEPVSAYRLVPGQVSVSAAATAAAKSSRVRHWRLPAMTTAMVLMIAAGGLVIWRPWEHGLELASNEKTALPLPDKPSVAVLPFANISDDPEQEYYADGMTGDLITDLSKISGLFVIARNSTFTYKGKTVTTRQVAEELGVRYVLEGTVRRAGDQVRINAQLIDATTGGHVWAERYDSSLTNVFALQDKITQNIVTALVVNLTAEEREQQVRKETDSAEAYDAFLRGWAHYSLYTPDGFAKSVPYFELAIQLDPNYGRAHTALAAVYWESWSNEWVKSLGMSYTEANEKTRRHLEEALKDPTPFAHWIAAKMHVARERWDEAIAEAKRAIALDANDPDGYVAMSMVLVRIGRPAEGLEFLETAMRLDPQSDYLWRLGDAQFHLEQYDEAAATLLRATKRSPGDEWNFLLLAAAYGQLGREEEAKSAIETFNKIRANAGQSPYTLAFVDDWSFKDSAARERLREGLRKAGLPEG